MRRLDLRSRTRPRPDWARALRDARALVADGDRTELAFRVQRAVDPELHDRTLHLMLEHPEGRRVFHEQPTLRDALDDRDALAKLPEGSLGRAYLAHLEEHGLEPTKLIALGEQEDHRPAADDPDLHWWAERSRLSHDLWHVVSGYSASGDGEAALLCFSHGQIGGRANAILSLLANLRLTREQGLGAAARAIRAWRRGRTATCLGALPWEALLQEPLEEVRRAAGIPPLQGRDRV